MAALNSKENRGGTLAVIPTVGASPALEECLEALRRQDTSGALTIALVDQGPEAVRLPVGLVDLHLRLDDNRGFTGGTNHGIAAAPSRWVATVNDDFIADDDWLSQLREALVADPAAAAAQGTHRSAVDPRRLDGVGLGFNRWYQAVQLGHGEPEQRAREAARHSALPRETFGVSATAALYRREALEAVALNPLQIFDEGLGSYYEDADLAARLRADGWRSLWVPGAGGLHHGALSTAGQSPRRLRWLYRNRLLVVARILGIALPAALPTMAARDLVDGLRALARGHWAEVGAILGGWSAAMATLPRYAHRHRRTVPRAVLRDSHRAPW